MHRGGFERWPTAPVGITPIPTAPDLDAPVQWAAAEPSAPSRGMAGLGARVRDRGARGRDVRRAGDSRSGSSRSCTAIIALRRPLESRAVAVWALVLGAVSLLYSAGWLVFAATRTDMLALAARCECAARCRLAASRHSASARYTRSARIARRFEPMRVRISVADPSPRSFSAVRSAAGRCRRRAS